MPPIASHILQLCPYVPGKPIEEVKRELGLTDVIKLASNENPLGPSPAAQGAIVRAATQVSYYPEGGAPALKKAVSQLVQMEEDHLVFGNGSDELLHMLTLAFLQPGDHTVQADPSFAMYEIYTRQCNCTPIKVPLDGYTHDLEAMADAITPRTRLVFVANPNNPTGTLVTQEQIDRFIDRVPSDVVVVFDEAYHEYVTDSQKPDLRPAIKERGNIVILRTFSKAFGLAGLRLGYAILPPYLAGVLNRVRSPFNVNVLAQAAGTAAAEDTEHIRSTVALNSTSKANLYASLTEMGLDFVPSEANFVLIDVGRNSVEVSNTLLQMGVIIRAGAGLGLPNHIRVTTGTADQNCRFIDALKVTLGR